MRRKSSASRWGYLTSAGYQNRCAWGGALRRFLRTADSVALLPPDTDWIQGGCLLLADALIAWSDGQLAPGGSVRQHKNTRVVFLDHAYVHFVDLTTQERVLIDADGLASEALFKEKLQTEFGLRDLELRHEDCSSLAIGVIRDLKVSQALAKRLERRFGRFSLPAL